MNMKTQDSTGLPGRYAIPRKIGWNKYGRTGLSYFFFAHRGERAGRYFMCLLAGITIMLFGYQTIQPAHGAEAVGDETSDPPKSPPAVDCLSAGHLTNDLTPEALYSVMGKCIAEGDYDSATTSFVLAGIYGRFDALRVEKETVHSAWEVLEIHAISGITTEQGKIFSQKVNTTTRNPETLKALCAQIKQIGPPNYYPRYMIGKPDTWSPNPPVVQHFDPAAAWQSLLNSYLHCPKS